VRSNAISRSRFPLGAPAQRRRALGYASKLQSIAADVLAAHPPSGPTGPKTLVMLHRLSGYKALLRLLGAKMAVGAVRGFPHAKGAETFDPQMYAMLGDAHCAADGALCKCALCGFNREGSGPSVLVADAKECGEGVSFKGVRRLLLVDVPTDAVTLLQRVGRAVRFGGHGALPAQQRSVDVRLYRAVLPQPGGFFSAEPTADEVLVERLQVRSLRVESGFGCSCGRLWCCYCRVVCCVVVVCSRVNPAASILPSRPQTKCWWSGSRCAAYV